MKYQIIYTKTVPAIAWHDTLAEAETLSRQIPLWQMACTKAPEAAEMAFRAMGGVI